MRHVLRSTYDVGDQVVVKDSKRRKCKGKVSKVVYSDGQFHYTIKYQRPSKTVTFSRPEYNVHEVE